MLADFRPKTTLILVTLSTLFLLGFYSLSNPATLVHDGVLDSADILAAAVCHRLPTHSFTINGRALPLCVRCSGIYLGTAIVFLFVLVLRRERHTKLPSRKACVGWGFLLILMAFDGINSVLHNVGAPHLYEPRNWLRLLTGMGAGLTIGLVAAIIFAQASWQAPIFKPIIANRRERCVILLLAATTILLLLSNQPTILYVLGIVSAGSILVSITLLYLVLAQLLLRRDGRAQAWWHLLPLGVCMLIFTIIQILAMAALRLNLTGSLVGF